MPVELTPQLHLCAALVAVASLWSAPPTGRASLADFERDLAALREPLDIPGMSAAIAERGKIIWSRGFGIANRDRSMPAGADTIYHLASVTKPYAATVVLQLVEESKLDLDRPVTEFGISLDTIGPGAQVRHLLSHTSSGVPGTVFRYDGNAYGRLTAVVEKVTGRPFSIELTNRIIRRLGLKRTGPNPRRIPGPAPPGVAPDRTFEQSGLDYATIEGPLAMGYRRSDTGAMKPMPHPTFLFAAAGLVASAPDVARFSMALDQGRLLKSATLARAWTPGTLSSGAEFPYGLGWFVQTYEGTKLVWHFGQGPESSALLLKIPDRQLTLVALANSEGLSRGLQLGDYGDVGRSPVARLFMKWVDGRN
jgi:CubicO group peptidase (beta-lactamase class C family)